MRTLTNTRTTWTLLLPLLLLQLAPGCGVAVPETALSPEAAAELDAPPILQQIAVLGASASAGFGLEAEAGRSVALSDLVDEIVISRHEPAIDVSNSMFFLSPSNAGPTALEEVLEHAPTIVIAVDFLFWYGYGSVEEQERLSRLETGLELLDRLPCPILVGDLPDMHSAVGGMLSESQVPEQGTLLLLNRRVREWCAQRERAVLVPMDDYTRILRAALESGHGIRLGRLEVSPEQVPEMMQEDDLHPSLSGTAVLALLALDTLRTEHTDFDPGHLYWDLETVVDLVLGR